MESTVRHLNVLKAVVVKEFLFYKRYPMKFVGELANPLFMLIAILLFGKTFYSSYNGFTENTGMSDYRAFFLISSIFWQYLNCAFWGVGFWLREEMMAGTLEENWITAASPFMLMIGRSIANFVTTSVSVLILIIMFVTFYDFEISFSWGSGVLVILLAILAVYGLGIVFAGVVILMKNPGAISNVMRFGVFILCGVVYPITILPIGMRYFSYALPITYAVDLLRGVVLGTSTLLPILLQYWVVFGFAVVTLFLAYFVLKKVEGKVKQKGSLAHF